MRIVSGEVKVRGSKGMISSYVKEYDTLYVFLVFGIEVHRQQEINPGFILDFDAVGRVVGVTIVGATADYGPGILDLHWVSGQKWKNCTGGQLWNKDK